MVKVIRKRITDKISAYQAGRGGPEFTYLTGNDTARRAAKSKAEAEARKREARKKKAAPKRKTTTTRRTAPKRKTVRKKTTKSRRK